MSAPDSPILIPALPDLYPQQAAFVGHPARFVAFVAGIGSGKSFAGAARGLLAASGQVGGAPMLRTPNLGLVTAPTYPMLRDASVRSFLELADGAVERFHRGEMLLRLTNGSEVLFRSAHAPERLRGPSLAWWWGDEAALYDALVWRIMIGRLRQFGQPGYAWVTSTPRGRNWLYKTFVRDRPDPDYALIQARSADNIFLDASIVRAWQDAYAGDFARQELDGEFVGFEGLIYPEFDPALHIVADAAARPFARVLAGVDWGYTHPGVILVAGADFDGRLYIVHEEVERNRLDEDWARAAIALRDLWGIEAFYCDPANRHAIDAFERAGLRAYKADHAVQAGIQRVKARLRRAGDGLPRLMLAPTLPHTLREFEGYRWGSDRHGLTEQPHKADDHAMDALRYLVMGLDASAPPEPLSIDFGRWG